MFVLGRAKGGLEEAWVQRDLDARTITAIAGSATQSIEEAWTAECIVRERAGVVLTCVLGLLFVPAWGFFDAVLEPAHLRLFLWLRLVDFVIGNALFLLLLRIKDLPGVRLVGALRLFLAGALIALMCSRASTPHYYPYVLGFSLIFWATALMQSWPVRYSVSLCAAMLGAYLAGRYLIGVQRPIADEVAALFYLGTTTAWCIVSVESRRRLHYRTFLANFQLGVRNRELDATVRVLRETQARLVETEKLSALGRLIASLSHEINNPVNVLRNNLRPLRGYLTEITEALRVVRAGGDFEREWAQKDLDFVLGDTVGALETMEQGVERIQAVHNEMRVFVRGDAPEMQAGDLNEGLRATVNMFRRSLPKDVPIEVQYGLLPPTLFQPGQMNQVFFNLIQNAVDAIEGADTPGSIVVRTEVDGPSVRVTVEDTGPGVSAWAREHLFEPFFTTKAAGKGTGLGLAISYQIVQRHGGRIELDDSYKSGARFVVSLPIEKSREGS
jgi:signal transduction histidine kinase